MVNIETDLSVLCSKWNSHPEVNNQIINDILRLTLMQFDSLCKVENIAISVSLTHDKHMRSLNNKYRNKNKATNVLSFPEFAFTYKDLSKIQIKRNNIFLGSILLGYQTVFKEAKELSLSTLEYFAHLLIHGTLHLIGFDHETGQEAQDMEELEQNILSQFRIKFLNRQNAQI